MEMALLKTFRQTETNFELTDGFLLRSVNAYYDTLVPYWRIYSDTLEVLNKLDSLGLKIGAITNFENDGMIKNTLDHLGISAYFNPILTSASASWRKPSPQIFNKIFHTWNLKPSETVMIGNSLK